MSEMTGTTDRATEYGLGSHEYGRYVYSVVGGTLAATTWSERVVFLTLPSPPGTPLLAGEDQLQHGSR
jgi:hypothetical protein